MRTADSAQRRWEAALALLVVGLAFGFAPVRRASSDSEPAWLTEINYWRTEAGLQPVTDQPEWDAGIAAHLAYLENTPPSLMTGQYASAHTENPLSPYYTAAGATEAGMSDLDLGGACSDTDAIDAWLEAPFDAIGMLRPALTQVALADDPTKCYAGLDVLQGLGYSGEVEQTSPVLFPARGRPRASSPSAASTQTRSRPAAGRATSRPGSACR